MEEMTDTEILDWAEKYLVSISPPQGRLLLSGVRTLKWRGPDHYVESYCFSLKEGIAEAAELREKDE